MIEFDPGYGQQPFKSLVENYPDETVYPAEDFRLEWGPIFHRGRLDRSAVVLVIGQDPAANETFVRRILVGVAGQRTQGLLAKLGVTRSYVMVNTFVYSVYGQGGGEKHRNDTAIAGYRNQWLDALLLGATRVQVVIALGALADSAWKQYRATQGGQSVNVTYAGIPHPTFPESASGNNANKRKQNTKLMLQKWNLALAAVKPALTTPDVGVALVPYGDAFAPGDLVDIPAIDLPAGLPDWMRGHDGWSKRTGSNAAVKRATLTITVPPGFIPAAGPGEPQLVSALARREVSKPLAFAFDADAHTFAVTAPIDPNPTGKIALKGRVVTMDANFTVLASGAVYVDSGKIVAVQDAAAPKPAGFSSSDVIDTKGTIYPGLIELHNHLAYNALELWKVPKLYDNRGQWTNHPEYKQLVLDPMKEIKRRPQLLPAIARYAECKCLLGGVTTSQGIRLNGAGGITTYFKGVVRNVEQTGEADLPEARTSISDVEASKWSEFYKALGKALTAGQAMLLHLSEGRNDDPPSLKAFDVLHSTSTDDWAINAALTGIHAAALDKNRFDILAQHGGSMVWSPTSNLLLYGQTARIDLARQAGVKIGIGSDWSPSGSKNLLGELKSARAYSGLNNGLVADCEIVAMATRDGAAIVKWSKALGSLEPGKRGDLLVIRGSDKKPYAKLIEAAETDIELVVINGRRRYGTTKYMAGLPAGKIEPIKVGGKQRVLYLDTPEATFASMPKLSEAKKELADLLNNLPERVKQTVPVGALMGSRETVTGLPSDFGGGALTLALDEIEETGTQIRPRIPDRHHAFTGPRTAVPAAAAEASAGALPVIALELDPLTVADDSKFLSTLQDAEKNLPPGFAKALASLY
jgi:5-methylthioadenosine/S-adenosylhomocysteine deaminase